MSLKLGHNLTTLYQKPWSGKLGHLSGLSHLYYQYQRKVISRNAQTTEQLKNFLYDL